MNQQEHAQLFLEKEAVFENLGQNVNCPITKIDHCNLNLLSREAEETPFFRSF